MSGYHFISYSPADAQEFTIRLCDKLTAGPPSFPVWLDQRELQAGEDWDIQIVEAIKAVGVEKRCYTVRCSVSSPTLVANLADRGTSP